MDSPILQTIVGVAVTGLIGLLGKLAHSLAGKLHVWLDAKAEEAKADKAGTARWAYSHAADILEPLVAAATAIVEKATVAKLKGTAGWTDAAKAEAKAQAVALVQTLAGPGGMKQIAEGHGYTADDAASIRTLIETHVEKALVAPAK